MDDKTAINDSYVVTLHQLSGVLFGAFAGAAGDASAEADATAAFRSGVLLARRVRDQALTIVA